MCVGLSRYTETEQMFVSAVMAQESTLFEWEI